MNKRTFVVCIVIVAACGQQEESAKQEADKILYNGKVVTLDTASTIASAVAIRGERIAAVGGNELIELYDADEVTDLQGKTLLPGFIDSHTHIRGRPRHFIDLAQTSSCWTGIS